MTTLELIQVELGKVPEERLGELYAIIRNFTTSQQATSSAPGIMEKLSRIRIQGPPDFSENFELYMSGEKKFDEDIH
jgi:hypothetical protein